jgi:hypothetical protein
MRLFAAVLATIGSCAIVTPSALAAAGDIFVADPFSTPPPTGIAAVLRIDPTTGEQFTVSSGDKLDIAMYGLAREAAGSLIVSNAGLSATPSVIRVEPATGTQTEISTGADISQPQYVALEANGNILLADQGSKKVLRIPTAGGAPTPVADGFDTPRGIDVGPNGDIFVSDSVLGGPKVVKVTNGAKSDFATGGDIGSVAAVQGLEVGPNGDVYVAASNGAGTGYVIRIKPDGSQDKVGDAGLLKSPQDIAVAANGDLLVSDAEAFTNGGIIRINPGTKEQAPVSQDGRLADPRGIDIEPTSTAPPPPADTSITLTATAKRSQRALKQGGVIVEAGCGPEMCTATATGSATIGKARKASDARKKRKKAKPLKLKTATASIAANQKARLKLGFSRKVKKAVRRALKRSRKVRAKIKVAATDAAGNTATKSLSVKIVK